MFTSAPPLSILDKPDYWVLEAPLIWCGAGHTFTIPKGWVTDLASIPTILRDVLDVNGRSRCPAIWHDALYNFQFTTRAEADEQLRLALIAYGEMSDTARVYWLGVRAGGWWPWGKRLTRGGGVQPSDFATVEDYAAYRASVIRSLYRGS